MHVCSARTQPLAGNRRATQRSPDARLLCENPASGGESPCHPAETRGTSALREPSPWQGIALPPSGILRHRNVQGPSPWQGILVPSLVALAATRPDLLLPLDLRNTVFGVIGCYSIAALELSFCFVTITITLTITITITITITDC